MDEHRDVIDRYKYLPGLLHHIRWAQRFAAILAEALILIAFLASGMDVSMGGILANIPAVKWAWAAIFSLGVDTSFVVSWVRCRELGRSWHLLWSIPVALCISFVVFEPVVIQLLQQALNIEFSEALRELGINLTVLVYARAGVAVFLGAILAVTNVESNIAEVQKPARPKRRIVMFEHLCKQLAAIMNAKRLQPEQLKVGDTTATELPAPIEQPVVSSEVPPAVLQDSGEQVSVEASVPVEQQSLLDEPLVIDEKIVSEQSLTTEPLVVPIGMTPVEREAKVRELNLTDLSAVERVATVVGLFPAIPDRELGRLSGVSAATAKKYRGVLKSVPSSTPPVQVQITKEGDQ